MPEIRWTDLDRPAPEWFRNAKLGIFVHWGPYSVPAWAERVGASGKVPEGEFFKHNPYAEWYWNSISLPGTLAHAHHVERHDDAPYDDFLDAWTASEYDPSEWVDVFVRAGARYLIPTTKHHDGVPLWNAPGSGTRNTVHRGPRRDLIAPLFEAAKSRGLRLGVYYSGGLDWGVTGLPDIADDAALHGNRPNDARYAQLAHDQLVDLIERYRPDVLWNDINWPDAGKRDGAGGLYSLLADYYDRNPDGITNDRWGVDHHGFRTSEYAMAPGAEEAETWEHCRGLGHSFGYNQAEAASEHLDGDAVIAVLADVVSRGGNLLLNVGPDEAGRIPAPQRAALESLAEWMSHHADAIHDSRPYLAGQAGEEPWVRWTRSSTSVFAIAERGPDGIELGAVPAELEATKIMIDGSPARLTRTGTRWRAQAATPRLTAHSLGVVQFLGEAGGPR